MDNLPAAVQAARTCITETLKNGVTLRECALLLIVDDDLQELTNVREYDECTADVDDVIRGVLARLAPLAGFEALAQAMEGGE